MQLQSVWKGAASACATWRGAEGGTSGGTDGGIGSDILRDASDTATPPHARTRYPVPASFPAASQEFQGLTDLNRDV